MPARRYATVRTGGTSTREPGSFHWWFGLSISGRTHAFALCAIEPSAPAQHRCRAPWFALVVLRLVRDPRSRSRRCQGVSRASPSPVRLRGWSATGSLCFPSPDHGRLGSLPGSIVMTSRPSCADSRPHFSRCSEVRPGFTHAVPDNAGTTTAAERAAYHLLGTDRESLKGVFREIGQRLVKLRRTLKVWQRASPGRNGPGRASRLDRASLRIRDVRGVDRHHMPCQGV